METLYTTILEFIKKLSETIWTNVEVQEADYFKPR